MKALLQTIYDSRKSFGGKALITDELQEDTITLISCTTEVAFLKGNKITIIDWFNSTTARHINEFLYQNGFNTLTKREMLGGITLTK